MKKGYAVVVVVVGVFGVCFVFVLLLLFLCVNHFYIALFSALEPSNNLCG